MIGQYKIDVQDSLLYLSDNNGSIVGCSVQIEGKHLLSEEFIESFIYNPNGYPDKIRGEFVWVSNRKKRFQILSISPSNS